jgi:hypothetical protein
MKASSLAPFQFWIFVLSTPIMLIGLAFELSGRGPESIRQREWLFGVECERSLGNV